MLTTGFLAEKYLSGVIISAVICPGCLVLLLCAHRFVVWGKKKKFHFTTNGGTHNFLRAYKLCFRRQHPAKQIEEVDVFFHL